MATPNRSERTSAPAGTTSSGNDCDNGTIGQSANNISASAGATPRNSGSSTASSNCTISNSNPNVSPGSGGNTSATPGNAGSTPVAENGDSNKSAAITPGAPGSSGHKGSIRGNKLARRARSFKDDFLEKISQIRTPTNTMTRSHSPNSPRSGSGNRSSGKSGHGDDLLGSSKPVQDLAYHVRQVKNALTHFKDVILKNKLEMLPGNGTVVLELIANVHTALQSYTLNENSSALINATNHVYMSLGKLLKLCERRGPFS